MQEQLNRVMVPVLLGNGTRPLGIARKLYRRFGVISHLYCTRPHWYAYLLSYVRIVRIPDYMQGDLLCRDLQNFSSEYPDLLFCLIPCTEQDKAFCMAHEAELEAYYVIVEPDRLAHGSLPYLSKEELPI